MGAASEVSSLFRKSQPEQYVSPNEFGLQCMYEINEGNLYPNGNQRIAGFRISEIDTIDKLYELIHPSDLELVTQFAISSIKFMNQKGVLILKHQSKIVYRARGKGGKLYYLQRHGIANGQSNGLLVSNFSFINDVTWMRPTPGSWQLIGPNTEGFDFQFPEIRRFEKILSVRELEILRLVARGFYSRDIARMLKISKYTVDTHRRNMVRKLDVANSPELITLARDMDLI